MELALILVLAVLVEMAVSFFLLGRVRDYRRRVGKLERNVSKLAESIRDFDSGATVALDESVSPSDIASLVENATEEDIQQAQAVLSALGFKQE